MTAVAPVERATRVAPLCPPPDAAFADFYTRNSHRVLGYCLKHLRSREEAEDAAQTTFLYAWRGLGRGVVPEFESAWLLTIARNVCLNRTKAAGRRSVEFAQDPSVLEDIVPAPVLSDELEGLPEALAALTEQQRRAILMREWQGLTYQEIALDLGLSQSAVETLLFRARRSLAAGLRRPLGVGSVLPWCKSLLGGGGAKLAVGAAVVAVTATAGAVATVGHNAPAVPTKAPAVAAPSVGRASAPAARSFPVVTHTRSSLATPAARSRSKTPVAGNGAAPPSVPTAPTADQPQVANPHEPTVAAGVPAPSAREAATTTVAAATDAARSVVDTATAAVSGTIGAAGDTAGAVLSTAAGAVDTVKSTVGTVLPPQLPALPPVTVTVPVPAPLPKLLP